MGNKEDNNLENLKKLENQFKQNEEENIDDSNTTYNIESFKKEESTEEENNTVDSNINNQTDSDETITITTETPYYEVVNGYRVLPQESVPYESELYPTSWRFSYRCPTTEEVAEFSTIDERDTPKIQDAITNLIRKCYVIIDTDTDKIINSGNINDGDRLFFFLKLREYYMQDLPIEFPIISMNHQEPLMVNLMAHNLVFKPIKKELLKFYNGRKWSIPTESFGLKDPIVFLNPTLEISQRIFKYMVNKYRDAQDSKKETINKHELDRKFLLILPFLYEEGNEKIESLQLKFKQIKKNEPLLKAYLTLANKMIHTNEEYIIINYLGDEEKTEMKFPGGWKNMFQSKKAFGGLFD